MSLDPIQLTRRLVDIESITYNEGAVGAFLADFLADRGFAVEKMPVEQHRESRFTSERFNVYAGTAGQSPDVVLSTHMDTVPPFIPSSEDESFIYGRGSCDAKGIIAAQIAAAEKLREQGIRVGILFVAGEERDSAGAKAANLQPPGQPLPHQRRAHRQSHCYRLQRHVARGDLRHRQDGALRLSGTRRQRHPQTRRGLCIASSRFRCPHSTTLDPARSTSA